MAMANEPSVPTGCHMYNKPLLRDDLLKTLSQSDPLVDVIVEVGGHQLHTSKYLLATVSTKLRQIFTTPSAEEICSLPLPDTPLTAALDFFGWLLHAGNTTISAENVESLLQLAVEYDIPMLHKECDQYHADKLKSASSPEAFVEYLLAAERYGLCLAYELAIDHVARLTLKTLKELDIMSKLSAGSKVDIISKRVDVLEIEPAPENVTMPEHVELIVEEQVIEVPAAALVVASEVFKAMIETNFLERKTRQITMPGKSYDSVKFMVRFVSSREHVPIPKDLSNDQLEAIIGLAEEYLIGRLKHACIEYMLTTAEHVGLDVCLFYLRIAAIYGIPEVQAKVVQVSRHVPTHKVLACGNYEMISCAPLILGRAEWVEKSIKEYYGKIIAIREKLRIVVSTVDDVVLNVMLSLQVAIGQAKNYTICPEGHIIETDLNLNNNCITCFRLGRTQFTHKLQSYKSSGFKFDFVTDIEKIICDCS